MKLRIILAASLALSTSLALAQVKVEEPWVRAAMPEQTATGAFMKLTAPQGTRLVEVRSSAAASVEIHEMRMDNNVMRMRAVPAGIELPAGKPVELKPGGFHVMMMGLKQPLKEGDKVALTLVFEGKDGKRENLDVSAPVRPLNASHEGMRMK